ncbi:PREDICTED: THAP domain-containing protein 4-like [Cyphomyrmex costatus]|uniref:THAP domain-containing protein 4-like n=1 Tax=Cyphomyrmex costatus TaxID=456900 RepID=UPI0008523ABF|nr:PREDICTED: THAP domain-containing protein 4-like [Cyphomyrmex costatus]XP_018392407.1 PREDICTED: THAP domain-containing protein 4-like [Cyphomyrmex costatus]
MRRDKWTPTISSRLCEVHFEDSQFEAHRIDGWRKLKPNAVPTLFDVPNPPHSGSKHSKTWT